VPLVAVVVIVRVEVFRVQIRVSGIVVDSAVTVRSAVVRICVGVLRCAMKFVGLMAGVVMAGVVLAGGFFGGFMVRARFRIHRGVRRFGSVRHRGVVIDERFCHRLRGHNGRVGGH